MTPACARGSDSRTWPGRSACDCRGALAPSPLEALPLAPPPPAASRRFTGPPLLVGLMLSHLFFHVAITCSGESFSNAPSRARGALLSAAAAPTAPVTTLVPAAAKCWCRDRGTAQACSPRHYSPRPARLPGRRQTSSSRPGGYVVSSSSKSLFRASQTCF